MCLLIVKLNAPRSTANCVLRIVWHLSVVHPAAALRFKFKIASPRFRIVGYGFARSGWMAKSYSRIAVWRSTGRVYYRVIKCDNAYISIAIESNIPVWLWLKDSYIPAWLWLKDSYIPVWLWLKDSYIPVWLWLKDSYIPVWLWLKDSYIPSWLWLKDSYIPVWLWLKDSYIPTFPNFFI